MSRKYRVCIVADCDQPHDAKGYCRSHYKRWRLHADPLVVKQAAHGSGWIQDGYKYFTVDGKNKREHNIIAERILGRCLPQGAIVHHVDEDRLNNKPGNLVICPNHKYHHLLHQRMRAVHACGNPNWRKCPYCGKYDDTVNMRGEQCGRFVHRECSANARQEAYAKRRMA